MDAISADKKEVIMERKTNNPSWCTERIQEKIEDYKVSVRETTDSDVGGSWKLLLMIWKIYYITEM